MVTHDDKDIRRMCIWAARRSAARLRKQGIKAEFEEILEICYLIYPTTTKYYDPTTGYAFLSYYYTAVKRAIYFYYVRKTGDGNIRAPKPLQTNTNITDKILRTSRITTISKPWQPPPHEYLSETLTHIARETPGHRLLNKKQAEIIREYYWNNKSYQEIADQHSLSRQRIYQLHHQALKRLRRHYGT